MHGVKRVLAMFVLSAINARVMERFQATRRVGGAVLKRFKQWRRLEDDVKMLTESGGEPVGRL